MILIHKETNRIIHVIDLREFGFFGQFGDDKYECNFFHNSTIGEFELLGWL